MVEIATSPNKSPYPTVSGLRDFQTATLGRVRHCKIVGTLGPSSSDEKTLRDLIEAGLDIARLNFSHGSHDQHRKNLEMIRRLSRESGRHVSVLQDLQGPKIRVGKVLNDGITIKSGE